MTIYASVNLTTRIEDTPASCPYYAGTGDRTCKSGCWQEPACITGEPHGGWGAEVYIQHNEPNPILVEFRESTLSLDVWLTHLTTSGRMHHGTFMTGAGTPPLCSCGWQGENFTGPTLAQHQREARAHVDHARRVLTRLAALA